jgi:hypothetical protein
MVAPARDPAAAGGSLAVAEMQTLFDDGPVRLAADGETQARAAGGEGGFSNGAALFAGVGGCLKH